MFWRKELSNIQTEWIGSDCVIHSGVWIGKNVKIGDRVKIQAMAFIPEGVTIEDDVFIGPGVVFTNEKHITADQSGWEKTLVKENAIIGANSTILPGVIIGKRAVIGAGSVVTKNVLKGETVVGNPANRIETEKVEIKEKRLTSA